MTAKGELQDLQAAWQSLLSALESVLAAPRDRTASSEAYQQAHSNLLEQCNLLLLRLATARDALEGNPNNLSGAPVGTTPALQQQVMAFRQTLLDRAHAAAAAARVQQTSN